MILVFLAQFIFRFFEVPQELCLNGGRYCNKRPLSTLKVFTSCYGEKEVLEKSLIFPKKFCMNHGNGCLTILFLGAYFLLAVMVEGDESSWLKRADQLEVLAGYWPLLTALADKYQRNQLCYPLDRNLSSKMYYVPFEQLAWPQLFKGWITLSTV